MAAGQARVKTKFVVRPTNGISVSQGLFRWIRAQGRSSDTPSRSTNVSGFVGIPQKGVPQALCDKPTPSNEGLSLGETVPWDSWMLARPIWMPAYQKPCQTTSTDWQRNQDTPGQIRVPTNTADRSVSQLSLDPYQSYCTLVGEKIKEYCCV